MSRYEDPEGTGENPAGGKRRSLRRRSGPADDTGQGDASGRSRRGRGRSDPWEPTGRSGRRAARSGQPPTRTRRILGRHPVVSVLAILATLTITFVSLSAYAAYRNVYDSIHHVTITSGELGKRPPKLNGSENILIIGSDSRNGTHGKYGRGIQGSRSDTSMLLHISPTHTGAIVISFPRDTMVPIFRATATTTGTPASRRSPACWSSSTRPSPTAARRACGGPWSRSPASTSTTSSRSISTGSSRSSTTSAASRSACPIAIKDPASKLNLPAGKSMVHGDQALAFVRERHIGYGSDLQRINRQQVFLASLAQKIKQSSSLSDPTKLYGLVHDIASSLTTDSGLTLTDMYAIANSLKGLSTSALQFIMAPVVPYPPNPNDLVEFSQPSADQLFRAIARDNHILKTARRAAHAKAQPLPTVKPGKVQLQVLNGTNVAGLAATTASQLTARGFKVAGTGNATAPAAPPSSTPRLRRCPR